MFPEPPLIGRGISGTLLPLSPLLLTAHFVSKRPIDRVIDEIEKINKEHLSVSKIDKMESLFQKRHPSLLIPVDTLKELMHEELGPKMKHKSDAGSVHLPAPDTYEKNGGKDETGMLLSDGGDDVFKMDELEQKDLETVGLGPLKHSYLTSCFEEERCQNVVVSRVIEDPDELPRKELFLLKTMGHINNELWSFKMVDKTPVISRILSKRRSKKFLSQRPLDAQSLSIDPSSPIDPWLVPRIEIFQGKAASLSSAEHSVFISNEYQTIKQLVYSEEHQLLAMRTSVSATLYSLPNTTQGWNSPKLWNGYCRLPLLHLNEYLSTNKAINGISILKMKLSPFIKGGLALLLSDSSLLTWNPTDLSIHLMELGHLLGTSMCSIDFDYASFDSRTFVFATANTFFILNPEECHILSEATGPSLGQPNFYSRIERCPGFLNVLAVSDQNSMSLFDLNDYKAGRLLVPRLSWKYINSHALRRFSYFSLPCQGQESFTINGVIGWDELSQLVFVFVYRVHRVENTAFWLYESLDDVPFMIKSVKHLTGFRNESPLSFNFSYGQNCMHSLKRNAFLVDVIPVVTYDPICGKNILNVLQCYSDNEIYQSSYAWMFYHEDFVSPYYGILLEDWISFVSKSFSLGELYEYRPVKYFFSANILKKLGLSSCLSRRKATYVDLSFLYKYFVRSMFLMKSQVEESEDDTALVLNENNLLIRKFSTRKSFRMSLFQLRSLLLSRLMGRERVSFSRASFLVDACWRHIVKDWKKCSPHVFKIKKCNILFTVKPGTIDKDQSEDGTLHFPKVRDAFYKQLYGKERNGAENFEFEHLESCLYGSFTEIALASASDAVSHSSVMIEKNADSADDPNICDSELIQRMKHQWETTCGYFKRKASLSANDTDISFGQSNTAARLGNTVQPAVPSSLIGPVSSIQSSVSAAGGHSTRRPTPLSKLSSSLVSNSQRKARKSGF